jgi:hypothetical protein
MQVEMNRNMDKIMDNADKSARMPKNGKMCLTSRMLRIITNTNFVLVLK